MESGVKKQLKGSSCIDAGTAAPTPFKGEKAPTLGKTPMHFYEYARNSKGSIVTPKKR